MPAELGVREFYAGKNIFITGGTGFVGVSLIEKLLRCIPDVGDIYLLLRPKKDKQIDERLEEIKGNSVFEKLLEDETQKKVFDKLKAIAGDVGEPDLGISVADREILTDKINIIFHSAATLDFAETLKSTVDVNLLGTRRCLQLARECKNLKAFVHVSSAYVNSWRLQAEEIIYPLSEDPEKVISLAAKLSTEELEEMVPELLGDHPNSYTFTKQMGEHEVQKREENFPCAIVRPSMIIGAWKEPIPGWTISKNGPQGFLMGASKGVIRRLPVGKELIYDYIPVDIVINQLLVAGFYVATTKAQKVQVYHCTSSTRRPFRWCDVEEKVNGYLHKYPLKSAVWYPHLKFLPSLKWFKFSAIFLHLIPALILDTVAKLTGGKPILMRMHRNVNASLVRLERFIFTEWMFSADETAELHKWLLPSDQKDFGIDINSLDWADYFNDLTRGARVYLSKEKMKNIEAARGKDTLLMALHLIVQAGILSLIWFIVSCIFGVSMAKSSMVVPIAYILFSFL